MKKVTLFFVILTIFSAGFAMTDRYSIAKYERVQGMPAFSRPLFGAKIFNSAAELSSWTMARSKIMPDSSGFDFDNNSLMAAYLGKTGTGQCISIYRIDETEKYFVIYAEPVKCSEKWPASYVYFKLKKTAKTAKIIMK